MKTYMDVLPEELNDEMVFVRCEHTRQVEKWGLQHRSLFEWLTYLTEEVGELAEAISEHEYRGGMANEISKEAIQVAALATRISAIINQNSIEGKNS